MILKRLLLYLSLRLGVIAIFIYLGVLLILVLFSLTAPIEPLLNYFSTGKWTSSSFHEFLYNSSIYFIPHQNNLASNSFAHYQEPITNLYDWLQQSNVILALPVVTLIWAVVGFLLLVPIIKFDTWLRVIFTDYPSNQAEKGQRIIMRNDKKVKIITARFAIAWILGVLSLACGFIGLFYLKIGSILFFLIPFIVLPPVNEYYKKKWKFKLSLPLKIIAVLLLLVLVSFALNHNS
jgi:hypothetical protein